MYMAVMSIHALSVTLFLWILTETLGSDTGFVVASL